MGSIFVPYAKLKGLGLNRLGLKSQSGKLGIFCNFGVWLASTCMGINRLGRDRVFTVDVMMFLATEQISSRVK